MAVASLAPSLSSAARTNGRSASRICPWPCVRTAASRHPARRGTGCTTRCVTGIPARSSGGSKPNRRSDPLSGPWCRIRAAARHCICVSLIDEHADSPAHGVDREPGFLPDAGDGRQRFVRPHPAGLDPLAELPGYLSVARLAAAQIHRERVHASQAKHADHGCTGRPC